MAWTIEWSKAAVKQLQRLDRPVQSRILKFLEQAAADDPRADGIAMQGDQHAWRYRVGDWRVICDLNDALRVVAVVRVGHRREVYR